MNRLVLWDIDGTLLRAGQASREPFQAAVATVLGRDLDAALHDRVKMSGKTDPQIARELLVLAEVAEEDVDLHLGPVLEQLAAEVAAVAERIRREGRTMPGAPELLRRLAAEPGVVQSVLTGNLAANAAVKLAAFDLDQWLDLDIGAYGSDHHDREELVPIALRRAAERHGIDPRPEDVWVVGDTPRDLACARAGGARCLLVGTGNFEVDELRRMGPDAVLADLSDTDAVFDLLAS